jgi:hypothetical protein
MNSEIYAAGTFTAVGAMAAALAGVAGWLLFGTRPKQTDRERKRREMVYSRGRVRDASIIDINENFIQYKYSVGGVDYLTSQDISTLQNLLPPDPSILIGPATVKYLLGNPANSIVVSEHWSGLRKRSPAQAQAS